MPDNPGLFGDADITGIGWGSKPADASQQIDTAALRVLADQYAERFATAGSSAYAARKGEAPLCPAEILRTVADDLDTSRAEVSALRKALAEQARRVTKWRNYWTGVEAPE